MDVVSTFVGIHRFKIDRVTNHDTVRDTVTTVHITSHASDIKALPVAALHQGDVFHRAIVIVIIGQCAVNPEGPT